MSVRVPFWETAGSCSKARGGGDDDGIPQPVFPENTFMAPGGVPDLKLVHVTQAPGVARRPLSWKDKGYVPVCPPCSALELVACRELFLCLVAVHWDPV